MKLSLLSSDDVAKAISMPEAIEVVKGAFQQLSLNRAIVPQRVALPVEQSDGAMAMMTALLLDSDLMGVKMVSTFPKNADIKLPTISAILILFDTSTGFPTAIMDAAKITALRTGAAVGAATEILAREESESLAIFGAGMQSKAILEAVCHVRDIKTTMVYDVDVKRANRFVDEAKHSNHAPESIIVAPSPKEAVEAAHIVCTATTSKEPVFDGRLLRLGTHINAVGGFTPRMREMDDIAMRRIDVLVVDSIKASLAEAGDLIIAIEKGVITMDKIYSELGELIAGVKKGREKPSEITYFKTVGNAVQDVSVAGYVLNKASKMGLGSKIEL